MSKFENIELYNAWFVEVLELLPESRRASIAAQQNTLRWMDYWQKKLTPKQAIDQDKFDDKF
tara:strand:- start:812 stop:997 length:186 start_codon:yes stop_codon:yes gene_type:complete